MASVDKRMADSLHKPEVSTVRSAMADVDSSSILDVGNRERQTLDDLRAKEMEANIEMRKKILDSILSLTTRINIGVLVLVFLLFAVDFASHFISGSPHTPIITERVIMTLIGGTVIQIASILIGINRNLFP